jgi:hypothetical protein
MSYQKRNIIPLQQKINKYDIELNERLRCLYNSIIEPNYIGRQRNYIRGNIWWNNTYVHSHSNKENTNNDGIYALLFDHPAIIIFGLALFLFSRR